MSELFGGFAPEFYDSYSRSYPLKPGYEERRDVYNHNSYEGAAPGARAVYGGGWGGWYNGSGYGDGRGERLPNGISGAGGGGGGHHHGKPHH